jgi:hypothetical protein
MANIVAGNDEVLASKVLAADHDMRVGMPGVEMINGDPIELGIEVALHLGQEIPNERLEIGQAGTVFGGNQETELIGILARPVEES